MHDNIKLEWKGLHTDVISTFHQARKRATQGRHMMRGREERALEKDACTILGKNASERAAYTQNKHRTSAHDTQKEKWRGVWQIEDEKCDRR